MQPGTADAADPSPPSAVPVTTAVAKVQDVPVFLNGLGTVQPLNVVEIKAQVNGTLIALPVQEGQEVHKDDIVAEIDPGRTKPRWIRRWRSVTRTRRC